MIFSSKERVEDKVIRELLEGEKTAKVLVNSLQKQNFPVTIQGVYKALKTLISEEIVIKRGKTYSLLEEWRKKIVEHFEQNTNQILLGEGEIIQFDLSSLIHLEQQWKNVILPLHNKNKNFPIFFYNSYYIWPYISENRKRSELQYYQSFLEDKKFAFSLVGNNDSKETETKKIFQNEFVQWALGEKIFPDTDYPTIFADYIITTRISKQITEKIEEVYKTSDTLEELEDNLQKIGIEKKKVKLIIERNKEKAKKLRKKLSKEFFVPQELIQEFDLY